MVLVDELTVLLVQLTSELRGFPRDCCWISTERSSKLGLDIKFGLFVDDRGIGHNHHWGELGNRIYDLTARQFSDDIPPIYILLKDSDEANARYVEGAFVMY